MKALKQLGNDIKYCLYLGLFEGNEISYIYNFSWSRPRLMFNVMGEIKEEIMRELGKEGQWTTS